MKKVTGILSLIGCCVGVVFCFVQLYNDCYSSIRTLEEKMTAKQWKLRQEKQELENTNNKSHAIADDLSNLRREFHELYEDYRKAGIKLSPYKEIWSGTETISEAFNRMYKEEMDNDIKKEEIRRFIENVQSSIGSIQSQIANRKKMISGEILIGLLVIILISICFYYVLATKLGSRVPTFLQHLEKENNFIRKNIDKRELLVRLKNLDKRQ